MRIDLRRLLLLRDDAARLRGSNHKALSRDRRQRDRSGDSLRPDARRASRHLSCSLVIFTVNLLVLDQHEHACMAFL